MPPVAHTTDLYMEGPSKLNASETPVYSPDNAPVADLSKPNPPVAPSPVPPPVQPVVQTKTVVVKSRMADETSDGKMRDTSMEAVTQPGRDLGFRNLDDESAKPPGPAPAPTPEKPAETPAKPPEVPPAEEKVYAGVFKSPEELKKGYEALEKAYEEKHKAFTQLSQQKAALEKQPAPAPAPKTPEQIALEETEKNKFLTEFVADPKGVITKFQQEAAQQTQIALTVQQIRNEWAKNNADIAPYEAHVAVEMHSLAQSDPELAKDPVALINKATDKFREWTGKIRTAGAKEALTTETRVIPLLSNTAPAAATEQPSNGKAPLNSDDAFNLHIRMLKEQEQRSHRGLRR